MIRYAAAVLLLITLSIVAIFIVSDVLRLPSEVSNFFRPDVNNAGDDDYVGTRWAVLIPGSNGYSNYRYQVKKTTSQDGAISQRDADLLYFWEMYRRAPEGSAKKIKAQKQLAEALSHRMHLDDSVNLVGNLLFGIKKGSEVLKAIRPAGQAVVDDWQCLRTLVRTFETHCGSLSEYGLKHMRSFANFCNAGIREDQMSEASAQACVTFPSNPWSSVHKGFNA